MALYVPIRFKNKKTEQLTSFDTRSVSNMAGLEHGAEAGNPAMRYSLSPVYCLSQLAPNL